MGSNLSHEVVREREVVREDKSYGVDRTGVEPRSQSDDNISNLQLCLKAHLIAFIGQLPIRFLYSIALGTTSFIILA